MNRTRYILRDEARRRERREAEIERQMRAGKPVDTGIPSAPEKSVTPVTSPAEPAK